MRPTSRPRRTAGPGRDGLSRAYATPKSAPFCTWSAKPMGRQWSPRVKSLPRISTSSYLESKRRLSRGCSSVITTVATAPATPPRKLVCSIGRACQGSCAGTTAAESSLRRAGISTDGTHDEHPPARHEMRQVLRQLLDAFARLLLEALHFDDLGDQHVVGLTDGLPGHVRRPRKPPIRDRVQRPADDVAILRHQTLKVLGQLRRTQLKPNEKGRRRTHPRSVVDSGRTEIPRTRDLPSTEGRTPRVRLRPEFERPSVGHWRRLSGRPGEELARRAARSKPVSRQGPGRA